MGFRERTGNPVRQVTLQYSEVCREGSIESVYRGGPETRLDFLEIQPETGGNE